MTVWNVSNMSMVLRGIAQCLEGPRLNDGVDASTDYLRA